MDWDRAYSEYTRFLQPINFFLHRMERYGAQRIHLLLRIQMEASYSKVSLFVLLRWSFVSDGLTMRRTGPLDGARSNYLLLTRIAIIGSKALELMLMFEDDFISAIKFRI